jgi:hypothetical protein
LLSRQLALRNEKDFVGLVALNMNEDDFILHYHKIYHHSPAFEASVVKLRRDVWLPELQKNIENGFIFRMEGDQVVARLGCMKVDKSGWSWLPLSEEEVRAMGLQTMSDGITGRGSHCYFEQCVSQSPFIVNFLMTVCARDGLLVLFFFRLLIQKLLPIDQVSLSHIKKNLP